MFNMDINANLARSLEFIPFETIIASYQEKQIALSLRFKNDLEGVVISNKCRRKCLCHLPPHEMAALVARGP